MLVNTVPTLFDGFKPIPAFIAAKGVNSPSGRFCRRVPTQPRRGVRAPQHKTILGAVTCGNARGPCADACRRAGGRLHLKDACVSSPDQARGAGANDGFTVLSGFRRRRVSGSPWSSRPRADGVIAARSAAEIRVLPRQYSSARNAVSVVAGDAA